MLYSRLHRIAFAHYPKTAGSSIANWFQQTFPDARWIDKRHPHLEVRKSLGRLSAGHSLPPLERLRYAMRPSQWLPSVHIDRSLPQTLRIFGVVRSPLELIVSLYEFWRRNQSHRHSLNDPFIRAAGQGSFTTFLNECLLSKRLKPYESFFDVGGIAWPRTRLIHFDHLESGLRQVLDGFGIDVAVDLPRVNCAAKDVGRRAHYEALAQPFLADIRRHFRWYYHSLDSFADGRQRISLDRRVA